VILKYRNKTYSSEDVPIFIYFFSKEKKDDFINTLCTYTEPNKFVRFDSVGVALVGNTVIKDKRAGIYINLKTMDEKRYIQRYLYDSTDESNAVISTPPDIKPRILEEWIERYSNHFLS